MMWVSPTLAALLSTAVVPAAERPPSARSCLQGSRAMARPEDARALAHCRASAPVADGVREEAAAPTLGDMDASCSGGVRPPDGAEEPAVVELAAAQVRPVGTHAGGASSTGGPARNGARDESEPRGAEWVPPGVTEIPVLGMGVDVSAVAALPDPQVASALEVHGSSSAAPEPTQHSGRPPMPPGDAPGIPQSSAGLVHCGVCGGGCVIRRCARRRHSERGRCATGD